MTRKEKPRLSNPATDEEIAALRAFHFKEKAIAERNMRILALQAKWSLVPVVAGAVAMAFTSWFWVGLGALALGSGSFIWAVRDFNSQLAYKNQIEIIYEFTDSMREILKDFPKDISQNSAPQS